MFDKEVCRKCGCHKCPRWFCRSGHCKDCQIISEEIGEAGALSTSAAGPTICGNGHTGGDKDGDHYWCN